MQSTYRLIIGCMSLLGAMFLLSACGDDEGGWYDQYQAVPGGTWEIGERLEYTVEVDDTLSNNHFYLNVRNNGDYPFQNLYLFFHTEFPNGKSAVDTVQLILAGETGQWIGKGSGSLYQSKHMFKFSRRFPLIGTYKFGVEHGMREEALEGISDVGLRLEVVTAQ